MSIELQTTESSAPARTADTVALEIRTLRHQVQGIVLNCAIEIGRRLEEVKAMLPHGEWGAWLKRELDYSQSTAQNFMRIYREYGDSQQSLFGGIPKSQTFGSLTYSKALSLLAIPDEEERARFAEEHDIEGMSTRELAEAIKARDAAEEEAASAQDEIRKLKGEVDAARADVQSAENRAKGLEMKLEAAKLQAKTTTDALSRKTAELSELEAELEELRGRPTEADTGAVEAARKAAIAEMTDKVNKAKDAKAKAEEKRKAAEEALAAARKELEALKAKEPTVRELTQEEKDALTSEAVAQARSETAETIRLMEKKLAAADPSVSEFKVRYSAWQEDFNKMSALLAKIEQTDEAKAAKLRQAIKAALEQMKLN